MREARLALKVLCTRAALNCEKLCTPISAQTINPIQKAK